MTDRRRHRGPVLSPAEEEIVRVFAAALRQVREQETELFQLTTLYRLKLFRAGMAELGADLAGAFDPGPTA